MITKEDVESLGWTLKYSLERYSGVVLIFSKPTSQNYHWLIEKYPEAKLEICLNKRIVIFIGNDIHEQVYFSGFLDSKEDLERILKQIQF